MINLKQLVIDSTGQQVDDDDMEPLVELLNLSEWLANMPLTDVKTSWSKIFPTTPFPDDDYAATTDMGNALIDEQIGNHAKSVLEQHLNVTITRVNDFLIGYESLDQVIEMLDL